MATYDIKFSNGSSISERAVQAASEEEAKQKLLKDYGKVEITQVKKRSDAEMLDACSTAMDSLAKRMDSFASRRDDSGVTEASGRKDADTTAAEHRQREAYHNQEAGRPKTPPLVAKAHWAAAKAHAAAAKEIERENMPQPGLSRKAFEASKAAPRG